MVRTLAYQILVFLLVFLRFLVFLVGRKLSVLLYGAVLLRIGSHDVELGRRSRQDTEEAGKEGAMSLCKKKELFGTLCRPGLFACLLDGQSE